MERLYYISKPRFRMFLIVCTPFTICRGSAVTRSAVGTLVCPRQTRRTDYPHRPVMPLAMFILIGVCRDFSFPRHITIVVVDRTRARCFFPRPTLRTTSRAFRKDCGGPSLPWPRSDTETWRPKRTWACSSALCARWPECLPSPYPFPSSCRTFRCSTRTRRWVAIVGGVFDCVQLHVKLFNNGYYTTSNERFEWLPVTLREQ